MRAKQGSFPTICDKRFCDKARGCCEGCFNVLIPHTTITWRIVQHRGIFGRVSPVKMAIDLTVND